MAQINKPNLHFNTKLYTGNGGTQAVTGVGFQPDWVWIKNRGVAESHVLFDVLRGVQKALNSDSSSAEATSSNYLTAFGTDGFTVGASGLVNDNSNTYASWNWKAGGSGSSNSDGSLSATLSANATAGFSVSTFTTPGSGTFTVGHGLGVAPKMVMYRPTGSSSWQVGHDSLGWTNFLALNNTGASASNTAFGNTAPTTSVWTGNTANVGTNAPCVAYCFSEIKGYSKFGKSIGNGDTNGPYVYTGFKPAFVLAKNSSISDWWSMFDNKRLGFNSSDSPRLLFPNANSSESNSKMLDLTSNGFKIRSSNTGINGNGNTTIYMAFAENPIVGTNNIPATAG
jgi:hypothetical protein